MNKALLVLMLALPATAQAKPASLALVSGTVTVVSQGKKTPGKKGQELKNADRVATGSASTAVIEMPDGSMLKIKELSSLTLEMPDPSLFGATLDAGGVFAQVMKRVAGTEFRVRAGGAVASVRGTKFFTAFGRDGKTGKDVWVCVNEGAVDVGSGTSKKSVPAGKGVLVGGGKVGDPQAFEWTKGLNWNMDPKNGSVEDKTTLDKAYSDLLDQDYR